jgi:hypothetical protein
VTNINTARARMAGSHTEGELALINRETLHKYFLIIQPIFKAACGMKILLLTPLPR